MYGLLYGYSYGLRIGIPLRYAGIVSVFKGELSLPGPGTIVVEVLAMDPPNANFGQVQRTFTVSP